MMLELLGSILSIVVIDLVLSGDNALVIGMAAHRLEPRQRRGAIVVGGAGAIVLRIIFTALAAVLLKIPLLEAAGGLLLTWIAYKLLREEQEEVSGIEAKESFFAAVQTIVMADLVMSLDNMLAVGGASHGSLGLLLFGLLLSMPLLLLGSSLIARILNRFPWLMIVGSMVLTITAARMIADDEIVEHQLAHEFHVPLLLGLAVILTAMALVPFLIRHRRERQERERDEARKHEIPAASGPRPE
jgi:YjbE family integral membrane protein